MFRERPVLAAFLASVVVAGFPACGLHAQTAEASFLKLAGELPFVSYGDFLHNRAPSDNTRARQITKVWETLEPAMLARHDFIELTALTEHPDAKVRTLALLSLYAREDPQAFKAIHERLNDEADTFPAQSTVNSASADDPAYTERKTVGEVARWMMAMVHFPASWQGNTGTREEFEAWSALRLENPDWIGWYDFLYKRASSGTLPVQPGSAPRIAKLQKRMEQLPAAVRTWMWFGLADDCMMSPLTDTPLAAEAEIVEAGKQLGPDALLAFLRDGSRAGLREQKIDDPGRGRRFILSHGKQLFREQDAESLREMGHCITAADAKPGMASAWLREGLRDWTARTHSWGRSHAVAALLDLCGDAEAGFVVQWFYETPKAVAGSREQSAFLNEVGRRKPKEWQKTLQAIAAHPGFERLTQLDVIYVALLVNKLRGREIFTQPQFDRREEGALRLAIRGHFQIAVERKPQLAAAGLPDIQPLSSFEMNGHGRSLAVSADEKWTAVGFEFGAAQLLDSGTGKVVELRESSDGNSLVHFRKSDGRLLLLTSPRGYAVWDAGNQKQIEQKSLASLVLGNQRDAVFNEAGNLLFARVAHEKGLNCMEPATGRVLWSVPMSIHDYGLLATSRDGERLAVADMLSKTILLMDAASGRIIAHLAGHAGTPERACFSPDGKWLLSTGEDTKVMLWDGRTGEHRHEYEGAFARGNAVAFTADSKKFLACAEHGRMGVFDCQTGKAGTVLAAPGNWIAALCLSADARHLHAIAVLSDGSGSHRSLILRWKMPDSP